MFVTITASVLINLAILCYFYVRFLAPQGRDELDSKRMSDLKTELADLLTDLNHVANTHVNAIENRKVELMRVLEAANRKIVRVNSLISDLEIMQGRLEKRVEAPAAPRQESRTAFQGRERVYQGAIERDVPPRRERVSYTPEDVPFESVSTGQETGIQTIVRLAREGWSPEDIAAHVRMSVHQVRQVLGLAGAGAGYGRN